MKYPNYTRELLSDIKTMNEYDLMVVHGIVLNEDKTVYDQVYDKTFKDIDGWMEFSSEDADNEFEKFGFNNECNEH